MICPLQYDADGGRDVFIYRNNGGVVERGRCSLWHGRTNLDSDLIYDEETEQIIFIYMEEETPVTIDDFEIEEYIPG